MRESSGTKLPSSASVLIATATSAARTSRRASASASAPHASITCVPLMSASPSLAPSVIGASPARAERLGAWQTLAAVLRLALADQHEAEVRQRGEIAAGADRAAARA